MNNKADPKEVRDFAKHIAATSWKAAFQLAIELASQCEIDDLGDMDSHTAAASMKAIIVGCLEGHQLALQRRGIEDLLG